MTFSDKQEALYRRYRDLGRDRRDVAFVGRVAEYRYYNMDQAVASALKVSQRSVDALN